MTLSPAAPTDQVAGRLTVRVLSALLREDVVGLRSRGRLEYRPDGAWLRLDARPGAGQRPLAVPVTADGFQGELSARLPLVTVEDDPPHTLHGVEAILTELASRADARDRPGFTAYAEECRQTLATLRLHEATDDDLRALLTDRHGSSPTGWTGMRASLGFDALAARIDHPVYPTARGRAGLGEAELRAYAPEFAPAFRLRWLALPRDAVTLSPDAGDTFDGPDGTVLLPVHPLTPGPHLDRALAQAGLTEAARLVPGPDALVVPTLSMRTVALLDRPTDHLKVPLSTATLGLRNRRTIKPDTLADGRAGQRLITSVLAGLPHLRDRVLHADETRYVHAGHELLAALVRRHPPALENDLVVPLAALLAPAPGGRLVIEHAADIVSGGDPVRFLGELWELLLDLQVSLFTRGIALESHQQNLSVLVAPDRPVRLLLKDNDGPRVLRRRAAELGLDPTAFDDPRTWVDDEGPLADLFATITVHLCAGAYAVGLAEHGLASREAVLGELRTRLEVALDRPGTTYLRRRLLEDPALPVKAMVTAGSLLSKERSGATDVNKHYTTGPNYLLRKTGTGR
ncbi:IucA/IucC family protein [Nocardioides sp.]|uniref:IucA/IucC family protein n=1 Tax=Nocardioides sp. TaxID=35761 RepID=UPI00356B21FD